MENSKKASNLGDMRKNYMIFLHDHNGKFACCGVLLNVLEFIAPTYCVENQAVAAYIHTTKGCVEKKVNFDDKRWKIKIANGLMIGSVSGLEKKLTCYF